MLRYQGDPYAACPCGSGRKFKFCHRTPGATTESLQRDDVDTEGGIGIAHGEGGRPVPYVVARPADPADWPAYQRTLDLAVENLPPMPEYGSEWYWGHGIKVAVCQRVGSLWGLYVGRSEAVDRLLATPDPRVGVLTIQRTEWANEWDFRMAEDEVSSWQASVSEVGVAVFTRAGAGRELLPGLRIIIPAANVTVRWARR